MLNVITRSSELRFAVQRIRCNVSDSLAMCPEYKVVIPLRRTGEEGIP